METPRLQQLFSFLEASPNDAFLNFAIAKEYEGIGDFPKALEYYLQLVANAPDYVGTYYHLGKLYERLDDLPQALQTYENGITVARNVGDRHALSELMGAKMELEE